MSTQDSDEPSAAEEPHPEINGLLQQMGAAPMPPFSAMSPEGAREFAAGMFPDAEEPEPVGDVMELKIPGEDSQVPVRVYVPESEGPYPALVYIHGGGWVVGSLDEYDATCRALVNAADCMVVSVGYRLSPEHKFPAALEDCYAAATWVHENAAALQVEPENVAIAGDSSGGNLAAAVAQLARDRGNFSFARQVLMYPVMDCSFDTNSYEEFGEGYLLSKADMKHFWDMYLRDDFDAKNPYAAPLQARDLSDLPDATVLTCGFDPLRDEGHEYAMRLDAADVAVNYLNYEDSIHGIAQMLVDPMNLTRGRDLIDDVGQDLKSSFE